MPKPTDLLQRIAARLGQQVPAEQRPAPVFNPLKRQAAFGLSRRDAFAIAAMPLMSWHGDAAKHSPAKCWQIADDMLAAGSAQ